MYSCILKVLLRSQKQHLLSELLEVLKLHEVNVHWVLYVIYTMNQLHTSNEIYKYKEIKMSYAADLHQCLENMFPLE